VQIEIIVKKTANYNLGASLEVLIDFLSQIQEWDKGSKLIINLQNIDFKYPLTLLPIASYLKYLSSLYMTLILFTTKTLRNT